MTRIGSLFSGIGALDLAVTEVLGGRVAWHSEVDPAAARVLDHHWPHTPNHGDITRIDWRNVEPVDVLTAGFPCQDVSAAGRRLGIRPGTRSGLWAQTAYTIAQLTPRLVVIENVRGLLSAPAACDVEPCPWCVGDPDDGPTLRALGAVLGDLANLGFDAEWVGLRAADVGACHGRFRVMVVAWPAGAAVGGVAAHPDSTGPQGAEPARRRNLPVRGADGSWGVYETAVHRWESTIGRPAPRPFRVSRDGYRQLNPEFVEWMQGLPEGWVTGVPGHPAEDLLPGLPADVTDVPGPTREAMLRLLGNTVVPQWGSEALRRCLRAAAVAAAAA